MKTLNLQIFGAFFKAFVFIAGLSCGFLAVAGGGFNEKQGGGSFAFRADVSASMVMAKPVDQSSGKAPAVITEPVGQPNGKAPAVITEPVDQSSGKAPAIITELVDQSSGKAPAVITEPVGQPNSQALRPKLANKPSGPNEANGFKPQALEEGLDSACRASGASQVYMRQDKLSKIINISGQIARLADHSLPYIKKSLPRKCPRLCRQINSYRMASQIKPSQVKAHSCPAKEALESYTFHKQIPFERDKKAVIKATHQSMADWLLSTFVYPYYDVFGIQDLSPEFKERGLDKACPSCSFYLDYTYRYETDGLNMEVTARCGDKREFLSNIDVASSLWNDWRCEPPLAGL